MTSPRSPAETRLVLIGAAVLLSLGMGIRQSFGLLLTPVTRDLALTKANFTLAVAVEQATNSATRVEGSTSGKNIWLMPTLPAFV